MVTKQLHRARRFEPPLLPLRKRRRLTVAVAVVLFALLPIIPCPRRGCRFDNAAWMRAASNPGVPREQSAAIYRWAQKNACPWCANTGWISALQWRCTELRLIAGYLWDHGLRSFW